MHFFVSTIANPQLRVCRGALLLILTVAGLLPAQVFGRVIICRKDPIVVLSNNIVVQMTATISTHGRNVRRITYVLSAPEGTRVERIIYTGGKSSSKLEEVIFKADQEAGAYATETLVTAASPRVEVEARTLVAGVAASATGVSDEPVAVHVRVPGPGEGGRRKP